jgi:carbamate kinase
MRIVAALGGNALLRRGEPMTEANQRTNVRRAAAALAPLCAMGHEVIITHGNGPQVGLLALQSATGPKDSQYSLDVLNAETEGMLGYLIEQELRNVLGANGRVVSVLTQVVVDRLDPAFGRPTKPIGPAYSESEASRIADERGWSVMKDGAIWRRAVASPRPHAILELPEIALLASHGVTVICVGGGGIPVVRGQDGRLHGIEAVIDKDHASALLAREIGADCLLLLTDVDAVYLGWRTNSPCAIAVAGPDALDLAQFEPGSMRPKVEAATDFARKTGKAATIGRLEDAAAMLGLGIGTKIDPSCDGVIMRS